jgi:hypothetical protein
LIADAQDALRVGSHDQIDVPGAHATVAQGRLHVLGSVDGQEHPVRATELIAEPLDRQSDGRGVDHRQHLLDVLAEQPVEQHLVAVPQIGQIHPAAQIVDLRAVLAVYPPHLPVQCAHSGGQQAGEPQGLAFFEGERRPAVNRRAG